MTPEAVGQALGVSRETLGRLEAYAERLRRWNGAINLVARSTLPDMWRRHILDCGQLEAWAPPAARRWVDLGAGAGLLALIVAIIALETRPELSVIAVESDARKCAFMSDVARTLGLSVEIRRTRAETMTPIRADVVSARALSELSNLLALAEPALGPRAIALFPKGRDVERELTAAAAEWHYALKRRPSLSDPAATILELSEIRRERAARQKA